LSGAEFNKIIELLQEILKWTKFEGTEKVRIVIDSELDDEIKKIVYHLSDGKSSEEIAKFVNVSSRTVLRYWKRWGKKGIMEVHPDYKRRYRKVFSLEEIGMEPPEIAQKQAASDKEGDSSRKEEDIK